MTTNPDTLEGLLASRFSCRSSSPSRLTTSPCGFELYNALGIARDDQTGRLMQMLENFRFLGAPHVAIITSPKALGTYGVMDCGGYVATLLMAAEALGLNAIAQAAIAMYADPDHPANAFRTDREHVDVAVTGLP